MDRIIITTKEVDQVPPPAAAVTPAFQETRPRLPNPVPFWVRLLLLPLILVLPLLSLAALIIKLTVRKQTPRATQAWSSYLLTLLIISGFFSTLLAIATFSLSWAPAPDVVGAALSGLDERSSFPVLPSATRLIGVELRGALKPLVLLASPAAKRWFNRS